MQLGSANTLFGDVLSHSRLTAVLSAITVPALLYDVPDVEQAVDDVLGPTGKWCITGAHSTSRASGQPDLARSSKLHAFTTLTTRH